MSNSTRSLTAVVALLPLGFALNPLADHSFDR